MERTAAQGEVAIVNADGSLRSPKVGFQLTSDCSSDGAVQQNFIDFVGGQWLVAAMLAGSCGVLCYNAFCFFVSVFPTHKCRLVLLTRMTSNVRVDL